MRPTISLLTTQPATACRKAAYTLVEVMVATTILAIAISLTMVVFTAALKRATHTQDLLQGTQELRYASDVISQAVRSAYRAPTTANSGRQLFVPAKDIGYFTVVDGTWIDAAKTVQGWKSNMQTIRATVTVSPAVYNAFRSTARPPGAVTSASDVSAYFVDSSVVPKVSDVLQKLDILSIPATAFGTAVPAIVVDTVAKDAGSAQISFTTKLGVDVPNGTILSLVKGRTALFEVNIAETNPDGTPKRTELRYYRDYTHSPGQYTVLARDISATPLNDPTNSTSGTTVPFTIATSATNYVVMNLQKIPKGTLAGRTLQGLQTTAFTRNLNSQ